ncbi:MAG: BREX system P-loop protein BrxC, partial [Actinomycetota bacterium]|nr:BREX system P-loop protein BrxC [Actinomycetota bacterium]
MTANWELFAKDPRTWDIPNQGVTKVGTPKDEGDWEVLEWELESFVCDGEYARGLERMLNDYLGGLSRPEQIAAWVSGFYGSGKSHLTRMLAELWIDREMPNGASARSLANLSVDVNDAFIELDNAGKRGGGRWAATGKLGSGVTGSYRLALLSILFDSAGLPTQYPAARFALKLQSEGVYDAVVRSLEEAGKEPRREFLQLYVSGPLHEAVLEHLPDFAKDRAELREMLRTEYPRVNDISDHDLKIVMQMVLETQSSVDGEIPLTVIVLDEVQQYVAQDDDRLDHVQNITELISASFESKVMVVGTGQSALAGSPLLSKMQHRFPTKVELSDKDVEQVTRQLVLRKKPEMVPTLAIAIDGVRGEIDRHLSGTQIAASAHDAPDLPHDYPILPVRRRLWEKMLRAVDVSGGAGQLRTQLRMTHEANQQVADLDVPSVIGADYIYFDQAQGMLSGRVLSQDMYQRIIDCDDGTPEGKLQQRVLALVFMISQLPREAGADIEVRSRPDTLAELLVTDLVAGSGRL